MTQPRIPVAVYRLQFHPGMRFEDARGLIPYFHGLGITDLYSSPILQARRGSTHGYDVTDPSRLNSETRKNLKTSSANCRQMEWGSSWTSFQTTWPPVARTHGGWIC